MTRGAIISLRELVGIPYVDRGRAISGADCWGIVQLYHWHILGIRLPSYLAAYQSADDLASSALAVVVSRQAWHAVHKGAVEPGDVVVLRLGGFPCHCGAMLGGSSQFLHTLRGRNSAIEDLNAVTWRDRIEGVYRWAS